MCSLQSEPVRVDDPGEDGPEEHTVEYHLHRKREEQAPKIDHGSANTHLFWLIGGVVLRVVTDAYAPAKTTRGRRRRRAWARGAAPPWRAPRRAPCRTRQCRRTTSCCRTSPGAATGGTPGRPTRAPAARTEGAAKANRARGSGPPAGSASGGGAWRRGARPEEPNQSLGTAAAGWRERGRSRRGRSNGPSSRRAGCPGLADFVVDGKTIAPRVRGLRITNSRCRRCIRCFLFIGDHDRLAFFF